MYADNTIYCIADNVHQAVAQLNKALCELNLWRLNNRLTPHASYFSQIYKSSFIGPVAPDLIGDSLISRVDQQIATTCTRGYYR